MTVNIFVFGFKTPSENTVYPVTSSKMMTGPLLRQVVRKPDQPFQERHRVALTLPQTDRRNRSTSTTRAAQR